MEEIGIKCELGRQAAWCMASDDAKGLVPRVICSQQGDLMVGWVKIAEVACDLISKGLDLCRLGSRFVELSRRQMAVRSRIEGLMHDTGFTKDISRRSVPKRG